MAVHMDIVEDYERRLNNVATSPASEIRSDETLREKVYQLYEKNIKSYTDYNEMKWIDLKKDPEKQKAYEKVVKDMYRSFSILEEVTRQAIIKVGKMIKNIIEDE